MFFHKQELQFKATGVDARYYRTTDLPNVVEKVAGSIQDKLHKE